MNEADLQLIDRYLSGALTPAEVQKVESRLSEDLDFARSLRQYQQQDNYLDYRAKGGVLPSDLDAVAADFWQGADAESEPEAAPTASIRPIRRYLSIAAAISLLLFAGWWLSRGSATVDGPSLYADQMVLPRIDNSIRGELDPADSLYQAAVTAYNAGELSTARPLMDRYLEEYGLDSELLLAYAAASIELGAYDEAEIALRQLDASTSLLRNEVPFYRALMLLKQGEVAAARELLQTVTNGDQKLEDLKKLLAE
ncbi:MAG: hypothetical protein AAF433_03595 [Bacteroidota bacterium]